jgi:hypothetical protein
MGKTFTPSCYVIIPLTLDIERTDIENELMKEGKEIENLA